MPTPLADMVRDKIDAGTLPCGVPAKLRTGNGSGKPCTACQQPIVPAEAEYEPQYDAARPTIVLHVQCHEVSLEELRRRRSLPPE